MFKEHTYIIVKLKVPKVIQGDYEAIDDWLNKLEYEFRSLDDEFNSSDPLDAEIVENQFDFVIGL